MVKKIYLKDLTPEEIIRRLKNGEVIRFSTTNSTIKMIDGVICYINSVEKIIGDNIHIFNDYNKYFEEEEAFKIKKTGLYKTRDGNKVFVCKLYKNSCRGIFDGDDNTNIWFLDGFYNSTKTSSPYDIISEWED